MPDWNRCLFASKVLEVKHAYRLTVDRREAAALEQVLRQCQRTALAPVICAAAPARLTATHRDPGTPIDVLSRYDEDRNGRVTCKEARRHAIVPVHRSHPAYRYMRDGDRDGVVCE